MNRYTLHDKIFAVPNADKGTWVESHDEKEHGYGRLVHPFKALYTSPPNSGKTTTMINCFLRIQTSSRPFKTLIIIQPSTSKEWDSLDPTLILHDIPDAESLVDPDNGKTCIIIDDYDLSKLSKVQQQRFSKLFRYIGSHHNISIMLSYQSFFDVPTILRKCCGYFFLWKTRNRDEINIIAKRTGYNKETFRYLFDTYINDKRDFLVVDCLLDNIRLNLFHVIDKDEYENL